MPDIDDRVKYSEAASGGALASSIDEQDLFALATADADSETGYISKVSRFLTMATKIVKGINWTSDLRTTSKNIIGAINEVKDGSGVWLTHTLSAGSVTVMFNDASISSSSSFDVYTDKFGVNPINMSVTDHFLFVTFEAQTEDISVKVRVF